MELYELIEITKKYSVIVIFGFFNIGKAVYSEIETKLSDKTLLFCDNDVNKQEYKRVLSVNQAVQYYKDALFITVSLYHYQSMREQLLKEGVKNENIVNYIPYSYNVKYQMEQMIYRTTPLAELQFEVDLAEHCNLNCKYCDHFSPLARNKFPDYEKFQKDINRLAELFDRKAKRIYLLGGEPLLNLDIVDYLQCVRRAFFSTDIMIITNGLLLNKMQDIFWQACRENDIKIIITRYPIAEELYKDVEIKCQNESVQWSYWGDTKFCKYSYHYPLDLEGKQDERDMFIHCNNANNCITLKDGKLYTCSVAPNIEHFNQFFNENVVLSEDDGIDIYKVESKNEILSFLSKPIPFCKYCKVHDRTYEHKWGISNKKIEEWT